MILTKIAFWTAYSQQETEARPRSHCTALLTAGQKVNVRRGQTL